MSFIGAVLAVRIGRGGSRTESRQAQSTDTHDDRSASLHTVPPS
jgi:hypothetical protein